MPPGAVIPAVTPAQPPRASRDDHQYGRVLRALAAAEEPVRVIVERGPGVTRLVCQLVNLAAETTASISWTTWADRAHADA
jgi:hypothetical protein